MVIRAKDQASRVINSMSRGVSADFKRLQTAATLSAQRSSIDMARVRQSYANQILSQQKVLNGALQQGNKTRAQSARQAIRDLRIMQQAEVLGIKQEQIAQREIMLTAQKQHEARRAAVEAKQEAARAAGQWIAVGAGMALAGGAGVVALHRMAQSAVEYERQAALTLTQTDKIHTSVSDLQKISTSVARSIGVPLETLQPALYDIFSSMDVNIGEAQTLLTAFAKEAVAGQVSIQEASRATIGIMNAYHVPVSKVNDVLDFQFQLVRKGVGTFQQFATTIGRAVPSAVRAGQSYQTLGAMMAFLTRNGLSAAMAAASAGRALDAFANPRVVARFSELGTVIEKSSGLSATALRNLGIDTGKVSVQIKDAHGNFRGFVPVMGELSAVLMKLPPVSRAAILQELFKGAGGTIQAMRYFNTVLPGFKQQNDLLNDMFRASGAAGKSYDQMAKTLAARTEVLNNNWKIFKIELGQGAIPALNKLIEVGTSVLSWLNDLTPTQKRVIAQVIAFTSVVVGLMGVLIALAGTVKLVGASFAILRLEGTITALRGVAASSIAANASLTTLASTFGLLAAAILLAANASKIDQKADELGARIHKEYVRPLYERLGLVGETGKQTVVFAGKTAILTKETAKSASETARSTAELLKNYHGMTASQIAADKLSEHGLKPVSANTKEATKAVRAHSISLNANQGEINKVVAAMEKEGPAFDGVTRVAKKSAASLTKIFQNQLEDTRNYSRNLQILLRKGADPAFIQALAKRGPEYVAAYARGSARELQKAEATWHRVHLAEAGQTKAMAAVAKAAIEGFRKNQILDTLRASRAWKTMTDGQKSKITAAMHSAGVSVDAFQRRVDKLHGKKVTITLKSTFTPPHGFSMHDIVGATGGYVTPRGIYPLRRAAGGIIDRGSGPTSDDVLARLSRGEYVVNARATAKHRDTLEQINKEGLPGYATGGFVDMKLKAPNVGLLGDRIQRTIDAVAKRVETGIERNFKLVLSSFGNATIRAFIKSTDRLPYKWGAAGPSAYDCSGLVGAVYGKMRGDSRAGHGARYFTTGSISSGVPGLKAGLGGGALQIGVTPGVGHMAGKYGGLKFEARSTATGIFTGAAARDPSSFSRHYHMARGGYVNRQAYETMAAIAAMSGVDLGGDVDRIRLMTRGQTRYFHNGGTLPEDMLAVGRSGRTYGLQRGETVNSRDDHKPQVVMHNNFYNQANPTGLAQQMGWELQRVL